MSFLSGKKASEKLGVHYRTLYNWEKKGKIEVMRSPGGKRFYNVEKYLQDNNKDQEIKLKRNICYIRVSTHNQKSDLENQRKEMINLYPDYELIEDIGSGINFNRLGFRKIIRYAINGEINKIVVFYFANNKHEKSIIFACSNNIECIWDNYSIHKCTSSDQDWVWEFDTKFTV